jgi:hypothetical protein
MGGALAPKLFPRGVADASAAHAFVRDRAGTVLALDLGTGRVLWRAGGGLRPLAAAEGVLIAARIAAANALEFAILDAADGRELRVSRRLALPDWVRPALEDSPEFTLHIEIEHRAIVVHWRARARYRGGAPPSAKVRASYERDARGAARVDLDSGAIEPLPESAAMAEPVAEPALASAEPDVLEQREIGDRRYQLFARSGAGGMTEMLVRAVDRATGATAWETVIDQAPTRRPKPLRP